MMEGDSPTLPSQGGLSTEVSLDAGSPISLSVAPRTPDQNGRRP